MERVLLLQGQIFVQRLRFAHILLCKDDVLHTFLCKDDTSHNFCAQMKFCTYFLCKDDVLQKFLCKDDVLHKFFCSTMIICLLLSDSYYIRNCYLNNVLVEIF